MQSTTWSRNRNRVHEPPEKELLISELQRQPKDVRLVPSSTPLWTVRQPTRRNEAVISGGADSRFPGGGWSTTDQHCGTPDNLNLINGGDSRAWSG